MSGWMRRAARAAGAMMLLGMHACGNGSSGGGSAVILEGDEAVQAVPAVLQSTIALLVGLRTEDSPLTSGSSGCATGRLDADCAVHNQQSVVDGSFDQCRILLTGGSALLVDGDLRLETDDLGACVTGMISPSARVQLHYDDLTQTVSDAQGNTLTRTMANGSDAIVPTGLGCAGRDVMEHIEASVDTVAHVRVPGRLAADGIDAQVSTNGLQLNQTSRGSPCERRVDADGEMDVEDRAIGVRYAQALSEIALSYVEENDAVIVEIDGVLGNECTGDLAVDTVEPIHLRNASDCPTGGLIRVSRAGRISAIEMTATGGLMIDYDDDGQVDFQASNCRGVAQCSR